RLFLAGSYRKEYFGFGATSFSAYYETRTIGNASYIFSGDINGDGGTSNDLLYIHRNASEMNFQDIPGFTAAQQAAAWDAYIAQDPYLSEHRGEYAQRGAVFLPMVKRLDFSITQDAFANLGGERHRFQFRVDFINFGNLLNKNWGVSQRLVSNSPLIVPTAAQGGTFDAQGRMQYRMRVINSQLMTRSYEQTSDLNDVYRVMFSVKYFFGS
ncbi:MAG: TonB-dependent receptor, partial [Vicinamibacterales bacterium]